MPLTPGTRLGPYEVVSLLGAGGMGEVYEARDGRLNRTVALKILPVEAVTRVDRRSRFVQEAQLASSLQHPNIVTIFDIGSADGVEYLAMEFVKGRTLAALIPPTGLRLQDALRYGIQIADALTAAHGAGIVHRDLKPGNIMVTREGQIKILDFGLATLAEDLPSDAEHATRTAGAAVHTEEGTILGTVAYMSPEQAEGQKLDARTDLFSFGAILYEMLSGQRAFRGNSTAGTLAAVIHTEPEPLTKLSPTIPQPVERLVNRCLRKDVTRRAQHASDIKLTLEELHEDSTSGPLGAVPATSVARRRGVRAAIFGGVGLAILAVGAVALWPRTTAPVETALAIVPLTSLPGSELWPSFSPDGTQVTFGWIREDARVPAAYVQLVGSAGAPLRLTDDGSAHVFPSWSSDGKSIAMWHVSPGVPPGATSDIRLVTVSPLGGQERQVLEWNGTVQRLAWSPDGHWLAASPVGVRSHREKGITLVSPTTGERIEWAATDANYAGSVEPAFSPDGRRLAFARSRGDLLSDIYVATVGVDGRPAGPPTRLEHAGTEVRRPVWTADGEHLLLLSGNATSNGGVVRVRIDDSGAPERIAGLEHATSVTLASNGKRLAISRGGTDSHNWRIDLKDAAQRGRVAPSSLHEDGAEYSPDGRRVVFSSNRLGAREIWVSDIAGENALALTQFGGPIPGSARWSPDGREIVFDGRPNDNADIFVVSAAGGPVRPLTKDASDDARPAWSHDGKSIYFSSDRSGRVEIWRISADGTSPVQVTKNGGLLVSVPRDGEWVYYTGPTMAEIRRIHPDGTGDEVVFAGGVRSFAIRDSGLWFTSNPKPGEPGPTVRVLRLTDRTIRDVVTLPFASAGLSVSPDERYVLVSETPRTGSDLLLIDNFR